MLPFMLCAVVLVAIRSRVGSSRESSTIGATSVMILKERQRITFTQGFLAFTCTKSITGGERCATNPREIQNDRQTRPNLIIPYLKLTPKRHTTAAKLAGH